MGSETPDQDVSMLSWLIDALDGDDDYRRMWMVALAPMGKPVITADERERLRREGIPPVLRL